MAPDLGGDGEENFALPIQILLLLTVLSLAPAIIILMTSFTRLMVVFSILRTALGMQQSPPAQVMVGLALFLTIFIMFPVLETVHDEALEPYLAGAITQQEAFDHAAEIDLWQQRERRRRAAPHPVLAVRRPAGLSSAMSKDVNGGTTQVPTWIQVLLLYFSLVSMGAHANCAAPDATTVRPGAGDGPTDVSIGLYVLDLSKIDEFDQSFQVDFMVDVFWHDQRLGEVAHAHVSPCQFKIEEVWNPGLALFLSPQRPIVYAAKCVCSSRRHGIVHATFLRQCCQPAGPAGLPLR